MESKKKVELEFHLIDETGQEEAFSVEILKNRLTPKQLSMIRRAVEKGFRVTTGNQWKVVELKLDGLTLDKGDYQ